jgi:hypothetical protein
MVGHYWHQYWTWAGSNIGAMPAEALITVLAGVLFRKPIARAVAWLRRGKDHLIHEAARDAALARKIAADTYRHVTGEEHPHAPGEE